MTISFYWNPKSRNTDLMSVCPTVVLTLINAIKINADFVFIGKYADDAIRETLARIDWIL